MDNEFLDLQEVDPEETFTFPPPEREVITQSYDLSVQTLVEQWDNNVLILPELQRQYVWDNARASRLIESLLLNIPIPVVYFAETRDAKYEIIDGHQRIRSVVRYVKNEYALTPLLVLGDLKGLRFFQLPEHEQRFLKMRVIRAVVISHRTHSNMKFEIFERLNTGSLLLNPQELRNSLYRGRFNALLRELVQNEHLRRTIGTRDPRPRMVDEELVLRFFALRDGIEDYRPPLKTYLNRFMLNRRDLQGEMLEQLRELFEETIRRVDAVLGEGAFRLTDRAGYPVDPGVNRALFDAQMLAFSWVEDENLVSLRDDILGRFVDLYEDEDFLDSIRRATGDRARTMTRVKGVVGALRDAGLTVNAPTLSA